MDNSQRKVLWESTDKVAIARAQGYFWDKDYELRGRAVEAEQLSRVRQGATLSSAQIFHLQGVVARSKHRGPFGEEALHFTREGRAAEFRENGTLPPEEMKLKMLRRKADHESKYRKEGSSLAAQVKKEVED